MVFRQTDVSGNTTHNHKYNQYCDHRYILSFQFFYRTILRHTYHI